MYPQDLRYSKEHEWIRVEGAHGTVGITDHAQHELGDVVYIELPKAGTRLAAGQSFGSVESVKAVSEIFSPAAGEVLEINDKVKDQPEIINAEPYGAGWILKLKLDNPAERSGLMSAAEYAALTAQH